MCDLGTLRRRRLRIGSDSPQKLSPTSANSESTLVHSPALRVSPLEEIFTPSKLQTGIEFGANSPEDTPSCGTAQDESNVSDTFEEFVTRQRIAVAVEESNEVWNNVVESLEEEHAETIVGLKKELRNSKQRGNAIEKKFKSLEKRAQDADISVQSLRMEQGNALQAKDAEIASLKSELQNSEQRARDAEISIGSLTTKQHELFRANDKEVASLKSQLQDGADQVAYLETQIEARVKDLTEMTQHWPAYKNRLALFWVKHDQMLQHANETHIALNNQINQLGAIVRANQDMQQQQAADLAAEQTNSSELWNYIQQLESLIRSERMSRQ